MTKENEEKLVQVIAAVCRLGVDEGFVRSSFDDEHCDIIEKLGFDSLLIVELIVEIENAFNMEFDMDSLDINKLKYFDELKKCIERYIED